MFLSDTRYLIIRKNLRQLLRDSRDRIEQAPAFEQPIKTSTISIRQDFFQKYFNGTDYNRTKEFYNAIRNLKQDSIQIPYLGTYVPNKSRCLIIQSETFAKKTKELRHGGTTT